MQGTLHMLILKALQLAPMHGYGIGMRLEQISRGVFQVNAGSLFPAIRRLERDGLIQGEWQITDIVNRTYAAGTLRDERFVASLRPFDAKAQAALGAVDVMATTASVELSECSLVVTTHMLRSLALADKARSIPGLVDVDTSLRVGKPEMSVRLDRT